MVDQATWRDLAPGHSTQADVVARLGLPDRHADIARFARLDGLTMLGWSTQTVTAYLRGEMLDVLIVAGFASKPDLSPSLSAWQSAWGKPQAFVTSTVAKNAREHVYARLGATLVSVGDQLRQLRLYVPCGLDDYRMRLYVQPSRFTK